jgi:hypothetical protein
MRNLRDVLGLVNYECGAYRYDGMHHISIQNLTSPT